MSEIKEVKRSVLLSLLALAMLFGFCFGAELKMVVVVVGVWTLEPMANLNLCSGNSVGFPWGCCVYHSDRQLVDVICLCIDT